MAIQHPHPSENQDPLQTERWQLLTQLSRLTDRPMLLLAFVWLGLLVYDLTVGLTPTLVTVSYIIWGVFIADFLIEITIAPHKGRYLRHNWLTAISLLLPAVRVLRVFRLLRFLRAVRAVRSLHLLRLVTSLNRGIRAVSNVLARRGIGYVSAVTLIVTLAGAAGMARFESPAALHEAGYALGGAEHTEGLAGYGEALWWTAMLMTTMGSQYWPRTVEGRVLCVLLALYAFAIFGYITATIASYFIDQDQQARLEEGEKQDFGGTDLSKVGEELAALRAQIATLTQEVRTSAPRQREGVTYGDNSM